MIKKRKVCVIVNSRANYARSKYVLDEIRKNTKLDLYIILGASGLLDRYGDLKNILKNDGFKKFEMAYTIVEGGNPTSMAKSTGLGIIELSTIFSNLKPDIVLTIADRFENLATAVASTYMNIPLAHTQGGEVTGSIDESVRHAITKLAHIHFPSTKKSKENLIRMGENPDYIFLTGCPSIDLAYNCDKSWPDKKLNIQTGVGNKIDQAKNFLLVLQHPVTTEYGSAKFQVSQTLNAIKKVGIQTIWLWPNIDAGTDHISSVLRKFREKNGNFLIRFFKNFHPEEYIKILSNCSCVIGNSSSAIREGSFLGVPAVNVGSRQSGREMGENVINTNYCKDEIVEAINIQMNKKKISKNKLYGDGKASKRIAKILGEININIQKKLSYK